jgi:hypothetical protein
MKYKSIYRFIDLHKNELCLRGEGVFIAYSIFEKWLQQNDKSLEELYVEEMNSSERYFINTGIIGLLLQAEQWISTRGKKHKNKNICCLQTTKQVWTVD